MRQIIAGAAAIACGLAIAPMPAAQVPSFEAASVRENTSSRYAPMSVKAEGDRLTIINVPLRQLIQMAHKVATRDDVVGGPGWMNDDRFDIVARASAPFTPSNPWESMLKELLVARFGLAAHMETRATKAFVLVRARKDGSLGPQLRPSIEDCVADMRARKARVVNGVDPCGLHTISEADITGHVKLHGVPMAVLLGVIAVELRAVAPSDATGLAGPFDLELVWTPQPYRVSNDLVDRRPEPDRSAPLMMTALEEQLGLKLEPKPGSKDVVVVTHVAHPTAN